MVVVDHAMAGDMLDDPLRAGQRWRYLVRHQGIGDRAIRGQRVWGVRAVRRHLVVDPEIFRVKHG
ncbi:MAG: hypothetical protein ABIQ36_03155 [Rhodanobacter sp.]